MSKAYSRRGFLRLAAASAAGAIAVACQPKTVIVEKEVEKTVVVEKEVEKVVKETVVVEKEKVVTPTPAPEAPGTIAKVPRNRTLIMAGLGGEHFGGFTDIEMFNPFVSGLSRSGLYQSGTEGLFYYNMIGDTFHPWLAESFEYSDDYMELTVNLRKGVEWSDGTPFTAKDVVFSILVCREHDILRSSGEFKIFVEDVEAVDDFTVKFTFKIRAPRFHWDFLTFRADIGFPMAAEHVWKDKDPETFNNYDPAQGWPLVTGPYKLVASDVNQKIWDLRPDWWAAKTGFQPLPQVERQIHLPGMNEITMAQMMMANEIDMAFSFTPANMQLVQGQNDKVISHCPRPPYAFRDWWPGGLGFNTMIPPFDDNEIRWAMSYALDRDEIIQFAFSGFGEPVDGPFPKYPGLQKYRDSIQDLYDQYPTNEFNPDKTAEIMTGKGYTKDGDGFWVGADGTRITFEIVTFPQHPSMTPVVPVVTEQLRRAGFDATFLLPADFGTRIQTGDAKAFMWGHGGSMKDTYKTLDLYHSRTIKPIGEACYPNIYRWANEEFDAIVDEMASYELDAPEIMDLHREAMTIWLRELPDIPVMETMIVLPMNTTYWKGWPSCDDPYVHEGFWHRTAMLMWPRLEPTQ